MIPKETGLSFGQDEQRSNACAEKSNDKVTQDGFCINLILSVVGRVQYASHRPTVSDQPGNFHFHPYPDCNSLTGTIDNETPATDAHTHARRQPTSHERNAYPGR
jgi:hypothetical protein